MESENKLLLSLNRNHIKYIVIVLMILDHCDHLCNFSPEALHVAARMISRLTATFMCYFIAEGYQYTHDLKKYVNRLTVFAVISHFAFNFLVTGSLTHFYRSGVITSLLLGLLAIIVIDTKEIPPIAGVLLILCLWIVSDFCDWGIQAVLFCLVFHLFRNDKKTMWALYLLICFMYIFNIDPVAVFRDGIDIKFSLYKVGTLLFIPAKEFCYNGKSGSNSKFHQYFFYIFYPLHLVLIRVIYQFLGLV